MRQWGLDRTDGKPLWWSVIARNKKSVTLDLRTETGQELTRRLIAQSDVVIENFRPGTMERWNLGYAALSALNPKLVMVRVSGYGQTGPYAQRAGFGVVGEAMGGLRYIVGDPSTPPSRLGVSVGDALAGVYAALGAVMALHARVASGRGQVVDSAIYEAVLAMMESLIPDYQKSGFVRERTGAILPHIAPSNVYPCADGIYLVIGANRDTVFRRLVDAMGRPELASDPRYATHEARGHHQQELDDIIAAWTRTRPALELENLMDEFGVPAGRIYRAPEMLADPHFAAREAIVRIAHAELGEIAMQNVAPRLSATPGAVRHAGPALGEDNEAILRGLLGLTPAEIAQGAPPRPASG